MAVHAPDDLRRHPRHLVTEACRAYGGATLTGWCADLLTGAAAYDDPRLPSLLWIGGAHAAAELSRGSLPERGQDHWPRVRAAAVRALGTLGESEHAPALRAAADDPEPSVRHAAQGRAHRPTPPPRPRPVNGPVFDPRYGRR